MTPPTDTPNELDQERESLDAQSLSQLRERLSWTPAQRLQYLRDMVAFEQRARQARPVR